MRVRLLGPFELEAGAGALGPRDRIVLSVLALRVGQITSAEQIADALWAGEAPATWTKVVQGCVSRLRRTLGSDSIATLPSGYRLRPEHLAIDAAEFDNLVARAREYAGSGAPERAASLFRQALGLWHGRPYEELEEWNPGRIEAARLDELRLSVQEELLEARLEMGEHRSVAEEASVRVGEEPWRERRWALLAMAQYRSGRQVDALASIRRARRTLGNDFGLDPGSELIALERAILAQDPLLAADHEARTASADCPWKGLSSYDAADEDTFFGRSAEVAGALARLEVHRLLVLAGPSGSGKSSLMKAGLAPALRARGIAAVTFTPGADGRTAMETARALVRGDPVLLVDQFEEAFTQSVDDAHTVAWLTDLASYAENVAPVVVTLRADQMTHLTLEPAFAQLAEKGVCLVAPLAGEALREAIEGPARLARLRLEQGLVDLLLRDAEHQPGALPLLSHALTETWHRRVDGLLTVEGYRASGGIRGAVAASADRLHQALPPAERPALRSLLMRMVTLSDNGEPVRTAVPHAVVADDPARRRVMDRLVRARLATSGATSYELAHEALVRAWPRFATWLDEDSAGQRIRRHLSTTALGWESFGRPPSELYRGARLEAALEWRSRPDVDLTTLEREFLAASEVASRHERRALESRAHEQRVQNRRLRALLAAGAVLLLCAVGGALVAVDRGRDARAERDAARAAELTAHHEALVALALSLRPTNRSVGALLAVEALRGRPDALAQSALLGTFTAAPGFLGYRYLPGEGGLNAALVPRTKRAVVSDSAGRLGVLDMTTGRIRHPFGLPVPGAFDHSRIEVSSDASTVAQLLSAPSDPTRCRSHDANPREEARGCSLLVVHDLASGGRLLGPARVPFQGGDVAVSAEGALVAVAGGPEGDLAMYDVRRKRLLGVLGGLRQPPDVDLWRDTAAVTFDGGDHVYLGSLRGPIREVHAPTLTVVRTLKAPRLSSHNDLVLTSNHLLVAAGNQAQVAIHTDTGARRWTVDLRDDLAAEPCPFFAVAAAIGRTYCGNHFGQLDERDLDTGQRTGVRLDPQLGSVGDLGVTEEWGDDPDAVGTELVAFAAGGAAYSRWRLDGTGLVARMVDFGGVSPEGYDPTGRYLSVRPQLKVLEPPASDHVITVNGSDHTAELLPEELWDHGTLDVPSAEAVAWTGPGTLAFWGGRRSGLLDVESGGIRTSPLLDPPPERIFPEPAGLQAWAMDFREDLEETVLRRFSLSGGEALIQITVPGFVQSLAFTPDGQALLVTYAEGDGWNTARYDIASGGRLATGMAGQVRAAVSSSGRLVSSDALGDLTEFDLADLQPVASLPGSRGAPSSLQFDATGAQLVVTAGDQTVQLYDVATRTRVGQFSAAAPDGMVEGWLRPDGRAIAINGASGVVEWQIGSEVLAAGACTLAGRNLTRTEWSTYLRGEPYRRTCPEYPEGV